MDSKKVIISEQLQELRSILKRDGIDTYVCQLSDYHMSEYVSDYFNVIRILTGFTGSNAKLVITDNETALFTDGRYFLQAEAELEGTGIVLMKEGMEGTPSLISYIVDSTKEAGRIAMDSRYFNVSFCLSLIKNISEKGRYFMPDYSLDEFLADKRSPLTHNNIIILGGEYCGKSASGKLLAIREQIADAGCTSHVLSSLDDIAYILNLRGNDIPCNPVFLSYLYISTERCILFVDEERINKELLAYLEGIDVTIRPYDSFYNFIANINNSTVLLSNDSNNFSIYNLLSKHNRLVNKANPSEMMKAVKNTIELDNLHKANLKDGAALVHFLYWLDSEIKAGSSLTEMDCVNKLHRLRLQEKNFVMNSFETIAGSGPNGAIIHYEPSDTRNSPVLNNSFLLLDTGAHYLEGTTDITRTITTGEVSDRMKHDYTLVLKAHIAIARSVFREGCCGANLDILARQYLWNEGLDYRHGTGHGIGFMLNVHEGPFALSHNVKNKSTLVPLKPGMLMSDEPGIYRDGEYGIRIENDICVTEKIKTEYGTFLGFDTMTYVPYDLNAVSFDMLTEDEINYIKEYHEKIHESLQNTLSSNESIWFKASFLAPFDFLTPRTS